MVTVSLVKKNRITMRTLIVLALVAAAFAAEVPSDPYPNAQRIVGGTVTDISQWPEMAALLFSWGTTGHRQSCGGTILNQRSILSAAHCFVGHAAARWQVRVGSTNANSGGSVFTTQQLINHAQYNSPARYDNDVAVLRITGTITYGNNVRAGSIAGANYNLGDNQVVWATGWGTTSSGGSLSEQLRQVQIWTVNQATCRTRYASAGWTLTDNMLCSGWLDVGGRDQCQGDSGGPLFHNRIVVGVCSWGLGCASAYYPGVNARVSRYTAWIQANA